MDKNSDFTKRASVHAAKLEWLASPMPGVKRKMLDRLGDEVARATTIVRYAPGSHFSPHVHTGGEEFLVIDGVFQDEHGDYPCGSYVRNPPQSSHTPGSEQGCTLLVKLWQFEMSDRTQVNINHYSASQSAQGGRPGVSAIPLHQDAREIVRIEVWAADANIAIEGHEGLEIFVLEGSFEDGGEIFSTQSWLRLPPGEALHAKTGGEGARVWVKSDHLKDEQTAPATL